jgi:uncharacterized protein involved in cysteine biosynthesis
MGIGLILNSFFRALGQIGDRGFNRVLLIGVALTIALLIGATAGLVGLVDWLMGDGFIVAGREITWADDILQWGSVILMMVLSIFLMVPVASAITSMFLEDVARVVEVKHYPHVAPPQPVPFFDALRDTVNFLGVLCLANVLALVLYVMFPPMAPFIFWGMNGFLLGREYFTMAATRHVGRAGAKALRARHSGVIWLAGILMTVPLTFPLINLFIPILGAATFTHLFHGLQSGSSSS